MGNFTAKSIEELAQIPSSHLVERHRDLSLWVERQENALKDAIKQPSIECERIEAIMLQRLQKEAKFNEGFANSNVVRKQKTVFAIKDWEAYYAHVRAEVDKQNDPAVIGQFLTKAPMLSVLKASFENKSPLPGASETTLERVEIKHKKG